MKVAVGLSGTTGIDPSNSEDMKQIPYVLHRVHVTVVTVTDGKAVIQRPAGS